MEGIRSFFSTKLRSIWHRDVACQTEVNFSDRLTNFGERDVESSEYFDGQSCDICELTGEHEVVGYCRLCAQYMCLRCCRHHEKVSYTTQHEISGKDLLQDCNLERRVFERDMVPVSSLGGIRANGEYHHVIYVDNACVILQNVNNYDKSLHVCCYKYELVNNIGLPSDKSYPKRSIIVKERLACVYKSTKTNKIYYTTYLHREIGELSIKSDKNEFSVSKIVLFEPSSYCHSIACLNGGLALIIKMDNYSSISSRHIQYASETGEIKRYIYNNREGKPYFVQPECLASDHTENVLYVSDTGTRSFIMFDVLGKPLHTINLPQYIDPPRRITLDEEDNIYIICGSHLVQVNSCFKQRILMDCGRMKINHVAWIKPSTSLLVLTDEFLTVHKFVP